MQSEICVVRQLLHGLTNLLLPQVEREFLAHFLAFFLFNLSWRCRGDVCWSELVHVRARCGHPFFLDLLTRNIWICIGISLWLSFSRHLLFLQLLLRIIQLKVLRVLDQQQRVLARLFVFGGIFAPEKDDGVEGSFNQIISCQLLDLSLRNTKTPESWNQWFYNLLKYLKIVWIFEIFWPNRKFWSKISPEPTAKFS